MKKLFYPLLFVFFASIFLIIFAPGYGSRPPCFEAPDTDIAARWDYRFFYYVSLIDIQILFFGSVLLAIPLIIICFTQKGIPKFIVTIVISFLILAWIIPNMLAVSLSRSNDALRFYDLHAMETALELYCIDGGGEGKCKYPGTAGSNQWNNLKEPLGKYLQAFPNDPCNQVNSKWTYEYWVSNDNQSYVLKATLQKHIVLALNNDLDGNIFGASCGENGFSEREYCRSKFFQQSIDGTSR